jgi:hypothetical protein
VLLPDSTPLGQSTVNECDVEKLKWPLPPLMQLTIASAGASLIASSKAHGAVDEQAFPDPATEA